MIAQRQIDASGGAAEGQPRSLAVLFENVVNLRLSN